MLPSHLELLRRGPGGEIHFIALPDGSGRNFTWMLIAGVAIAVKVQR